DRGRPNSPSRSKSSSASNPTTPSAEPDSSRHGHYDPIEREFCGFGRVESRDAETFDASEGQGLFPELPVNDDDELKQAPVLTKTWFHTGAYLNRSSLEAAFAAERWTGDDDPSAPDPIQCLVPSTLGAEEKREAHRALKGTMLRQEVYGLDGDESDVNPYVVRE